MKRCAFLSMADLSGYECDDELVIPALNGLGWQVDIHAWDAQHVDWGCYGLVIIRSTWDYQDRVRAFMKTLDGIAHSGATLINGLKTVGWNIDKRYLRELADRGVEIVPTVWGEAGQLSEPDSLFQKLSCEELVIKRVVGAGAQDAFRLRRDAVASVWPTVCSTYADKDWMAQAFIDSVLEKGELSLFYFNGHLSHAIRKQPKAGDYRVQEEYGGRLTCVEPGPAMRAAADAALAAIDDELLYARVDLVEGEDGTPLLMELELIEPALYFRLHPEAPMNFARAVDQFWSSRNA